MRFCLFFFGLGGRWGGGGGGAVVCVEVTKIIFLSVSAAVVALYTYTYILDQSQLGITIGTFVNIPDARRHHCVTSLALNPGP